MSAHDLFAPLKRLEFADSEVERVLARAGRSQPRRGLHALVLASVALAALLGLSLSAGRAGLSDAIERFFAGGPPPGERIVGSEVPRWLVELDAAEGARIIARSGDERLIAYRTPSGAVCFDLGDRVGLCSPYRDADSLFEGRPVLPLGPTHRDSAGRWVLWGVALDSVDRVRLEFAAGSARTVAVRNGFILRVAPHLEPTLLVALDVEGRELARIDVRDRFGGRPVGL